MSALGNQELELFQRAIAQRLGLRFDESRMTHLAEVLQRRVAARRLSTPAYLAALASELEASDELAVLARELTVGETYFFRHADQFSAFREVALPERVSARAASRQVRVLSAGCASGEEAYSLLMTLREHEFEADFDYFVHGIDLNGAALAKAHAGLYSAWSLRETPEAAKRRWFVSEGDQYRLRAELLGAVRFAQHNLILDSPSLLAPGSYDVIFCRNLLMYCTPEHAAGIVERLTRALAPSGFLFLGHAETLRGLSHDYHLRHTHNTFYYQRREARAGLRSHPVSAAPVAPRREASKTTTPLSGAWAESWVESVERSAERVQALSRSASPASAAPVNAAGSRLTEPLELLAHERFADALALLQHLSRAEQCDPAALLLRATLLTHQGELALAESTCHELLRLDDLNAGAHYLLALCSERHGRTDAAVEHDRTAVYLDGAFAMPHLHLGLMARRRSEVELARRELSTALTLLEGEDSSRLLLFGGGFSRDALLALCRSELANLKGTP